MQGSHCRRFRHSGLTPIRTRQRELCRSEGLATGSAMPGRSLAPEANVFPCRRGKLEPLDAIDRTRVRSVERFVRPALSNSGPWLARSKIRPNEVVELAQKWGVSLATVGRSSWPSGSRPFAGSIAFDSRHRLKRLGASQLRRAADQPFRQTRDDALDPDHRRNRQAHGCGGSPGSKG